jgi:endonuclease YncB( thermonuclease family)
MRALFLLIILLALPVSADAEPHRMQNLIFERVIDGATIVASGKTVTLWGVTALDPADPHAFAANLYLRTMIGKGALRCAPMSSEADRHVMHCLIDGADVGSLMVQMGMDRAAGPYYQGEQSYAHAKHRGVWHSGQGKQL